MLILRVVALVAAIGLGVLVLAYVATGERKYLRFAWRTLKVVLALTLFMFALLIFERLLVAV